MAVRQIPCRHKTTGATAEIAETALRYFPDFEPVNAEDKPADTSGTEPTDPASTDPASTDPASGEQTSGEQGSGLPPDAGDPPATTSKPATGAAKQKKE